MFYGLLLFAQNGLAAAEKDKTRQIVHHLQHPNEEKEKHEKGWNQNNTLFGVLSFLFIY